MLIVAVIPYSGAAQETRTFTSADGTRTLKGRLIDFSEDKGTVKVMRTSGGAVSFPLSTLSGDNQKYIKSQASVLAEKRTMPFGPT